MIKVIPHTGVNDYIFGSTKTNNNPVFDQGFKLEYKNNKLVAISFADTYRFLINGEVADINYGSSWLSQQNAYYDGDSLIFPDINMAIWGFENGSNGNAITLYADDIQDLYEKNLDTCIRYNELISKSFLIEGDLIITPYKGCGKMLFGDTPDSIIAKIGSPKKRLGNSAKLTMHWDNMILSFNENKLIQINLENPANVILDNQNIIANGEFSMSFDTNKQFINRAYTLLFDFGIAFSGYSKQFDIKTLIVFDESLKVFWSNTKRPLIL